MGVIAVICAFAAALFGVFYGLRVWYLREAARERLLADVGGTGSGAAADEGGWFSIVAGPAPIVERYHWVCVIFAILLWVILRYTAGMVLSFSIVISAIVLLLCLQVEAMIAERRLAKIESSLANAIDLMVGALRSGATIVAAVENAAREVRGPLSLLLLELLSRVRYGDDPEKSLEQLTGRVPLDSFRLFTTTLAVNWRSGGALSPSLAAICRSIRDRIEVGRRLRALTLHTRLTMITLLLITYLMGYVMWSYRPDQVVGFLQNPIGRTLVLTVILLQGIGIYWLTSLSKVKY